MELPRNMTNREWEEFRDAQIVILRRGMDRIINTVDEELRARNIVYHMNYQRPIEEIEHQAFEEIEQYVQIIEQQEQVQIEAMAPKTPPRSN